MVFIEVHRPQPMNSLTILGPDLFSRGASGALLSPIASVFPRYEVVVTGQGIHAYQVEVMIQYLKEKVEREEGRALSEAEEGAVYANAVSVLNRDPVLLIRSSPENMDQAIEADQILQQILPKEFIQFTGIHLEGVRKRLRLRGESWRMSPLPWSVEEIIHYIMGSRVRVNTNTTYYYNAPKGGRFLTYEEFMRIRPLLRENREEALSRLKEILHLSRLINIEGVPELSFFLSSGKKLSLAPLHDLVSVLEGASAQGDLEMAERLFDRFARSFADAAGPELTVDAPGYPRWRTVMFCRLSDMSEHTLEEWSLGLSPEFHLNIRWLAGACFQGRDVRFEKKTEPRVRSLISHFIQHWKGVVAINIGRVASPQTHRDRTGEERDVYIVVMDMEDEHEEIRLLRMLKWDVIHRLKKGVPWDQAISETYQYRDYTFDRLRAAIELGITVPSFNVIQLHEEISGLGTIPVFFQDRAYTTGMATDKIPFWRYEKRAFVVRLARLLGTAAGASLVLGRANPRTGEIYFDDGDEVIQLDEEGLPRQLILTEITGSFADFYTPMAVKLQHCLYRLTRHLETARSKGVPVGEISEAIDAFTLSLISEIDRMKEVLRISSSRLRSLFEGHTREPEGIYQRWESILNRLEGTRSEELIKVIGESPHLAPYRGA